MIFFEGEGIQLKKLYKDISSRKASFFIHIYYLYHAVCQSVSETGSAGGGGAAAAAARCCISSICCWSTSCALGAAKKRLLCGHICVFCAAGVSGFVVSAEARLLS